MEQNKLGIFTYLLSAIAIGPSFIPYHLPLLVDLPRFAKRPDIQNMRNNKPALGPMVTTSLVLGYQALELDKYHYI